MLNFTFILFTFALFLVFIRVHPVRQAKTLSHGVNSWLITNLKKQTQFTRIAYCVLCIANMNLKKQSQFDMD